MHNYFVIIDADKPVEIGLYLLAAISYSCIPFLYAANNFNSTSALESPEWLVANFCLIVLIDAITKSFTLLKLKRKNAQDFSGEEKQLIGTYLFYAFTGYLLFILLFLLLWGFSTSSLSITFRAFLAAAIWFGIRIFDRFVIPKTMDYFSRIFVDGRLS